MALDLATAQTQLDAWIAADLAVSKGLRYQIGDRMLTRENAKEVREQIAHWNSIVSQLQAIASSGSDDYARNQPGIRVARWTR